MRGARRAVPRTVALHLAREFLWAFALTLGAFIAIYVIADFFDRFDTFLRHDASGGAIVRYFLFKIPLVVTQATPLAVLTGGIVGLGLLARQHEFVALRACGASIPRESGPRASTRTTSSSARPRCTGRGSAGSRSRTSTGCAGPTGPGGGSSTGPSPSPTTRAGSVITPDDPGEMPIRARAS